MPSHRFLKASVLAAATALAPAALGAPGVPVAKEALPAVRTPTPPNPYRSFRYVLRWKGGSSPVAGFARFVETVSPPPPAAPSSPASVGARGPMSMGKPVDLVLEAGLSSSAEFVSWLAARSSAHPEALAVDQLNEAGAVATTRSFTQCRGVQFHSIPDLDAGSNAARIAHAALHCTP